jgi:CDP-glucose 4,6-dehydratase
MSSKESVPFGGIYEGEKVLVTGHTGFKGAWLALWLGELGAQVVGFSLDVPTRPSLFEAVGLGNRLDHHIGDVRNFNALKALIDRHRPRVIFHLAAQAILRRGYRLPKETIDTNLGGTVNVLEAALDTDSVKALVVVTSDKCYGEKGGKKGYVETDRLGGDDPYSASKAMAELAVAAYVQSFSSLLQESRSGVGIATARAGNVIGGGDFGEDRLVPDCIRALTAKEPVKVRHPGAVRPWQYVLDPLAGYLMLGTRLLNEGSSFSGAWNFGPGASGEVTVKRVVERLLGLWGGGRWEAVDRKQEPAEAPSLRLCCDKALNDLGWRPQYSLEEALSLTVAGYKAMVGKPGADRLLDFCVDQIREYMRKVRGDS